MTPPFDLTGKTVLVTGAGQGMGRGVALALAKAGADVAVVARTQSDVDAVAGEVEQIGRRALAVVADVSRVTEIEQMVEKVIASFEHIDILVAAAGTVIRNNAEDYTEDDWDRLLAVNLKGRFFTAQAVGRHMLQQKGGSIVLVGSLTCGLGLPGVAVYAIGNGGIAQMARTLSAEWSPQGIRVNCLAPGTFVTRTTAGHLEDPENREKRLRRIPLNRFGDPENDLGGAAVFLASDAAAYITGQVLYVDGGVISSY